MTHFLNRKTKYAMSAIIVTTVIAIFSFYYFKLQFINELTVTSASRINSFIQVPKERIKKLFQKQEIKIASLQLSPATESFPLNEEVTVALQLKSRHVKVAGVDIILSYNARVIEILNIVPNADIAATMPKKEIDEKQGVIKFSLLAPPKKALDGNQSLANIIWKAKKVGESEFVFEFTPNATNDTNIAEFGTGDDLTTSVVNAKYTINDVKAHGTVME